MRADHGLDRERVGLGIGVGNTPCVPTVAQQRDERRALLRASPAFFTSVNPSALDTSADDSTTAWRRRRASYTTARFWSIQASSGSQRIGRRRHRRRDGGVHAVAVDAVHLEHELVTRPEVAVERRASRGRRRRSTSCTDVSFEPSRWISS